MRNLEEALARATTVEEAALAASDAIDELVPGGEAISQHASSDICKVVESFNGDHSFQSFVLAVVVSVARVLGAWARVPNPSAAVASLVAAERQTGEVIEQFVREHDDTSTMSDPETRSLLYRLIGIVVEPEAAASSLRSHAESEIHPLARACLLEGLLVALLRGSPSWEDEVAMLKTATQNDPLVASRVTHVPSDYVGDSEMANRAAAEELLGIPIPTRDYGNCWSSELL